MNKINSIIILSGVFFSVFSQSWLKNRNNIYPSATTDNVLLGTTTSANSQLKLDVRGWSHFSGGVTIGGLLS